MALKNLMRALILTMPKVETTEKQISLEKRLTYLNDIPEVSWTQFSGNNVYIGFKEFPADLRAIINAAAIWGNRASGFKVHVWAVKAQNNDRQSYCKATAQYGKIEHNSCE